MTSPAPERIWAARYVWVTVGAVAMIFLAALQALAITTVMPVVSADLDGDALYAVAFAGTLATSVIGMVAVGAWCDRTSPVAPLATAVALFAIGLLIAGLAPSMPVLVAGRLLQGLGTGGQTVALYVVVARVYPSHLHGRVFAAFSAAWVIPSLVGPSMAGAVAEFVHWRWVFLGVAALTLAAFAVVWARLHGIDLDTAEPDRSPVAARLGWATLVAAGALALSLAPEAGQWMPAAAVLAAAVILVGIRPLLPPRSLTGGRGLPSVILMRALIAGALFGAEVYIPYLLIAEYDFSPVWAGLALTAAALLWAAGAAVQGRAGDRLGNARITAVGVTLLTSAALSAAATAAWHLPPAVLVAGWALAGAGMGLMYPRLTVLTLAYSTPQNQGFNSSALSISDSIGSAVVIAVLGIVFTALGGTASAFAAVFAIAAAVAVCALIPGLRMGHAHESSGAHRP